MCGVDVCVYRGNLSLNLVHIQLDLLIFSSSANDEDKSSLEKRALLSAIRNTTLPRLVAKDVPSVKIILWDLFHLPEGMGVDKSRVTLNVCREGRGGEGRGGEGRGGEGRGGEGRGGEGRGGEGRGGEGRGGEGRRGGWEGGGREGGGGWVGGRGWVGGWLDLRPSDLCILMEGLVRDDHMG